MILLTDATELPVASRGPQPKRKRRHVYCPCQSRWTSPSSTMINAVDSLLQLYALHTWTKWDRMKLKGGGRKLLLPSSSLDETAPFIAAPWLPFSPSQKWVLLNGLAVCIDELPASLSPPASPPIVWKGYRVARNWIVIDFVLIRPVAPSHLLLDPRVPWRVGTELHYST